MAKLLKREKKSLQTTTETIPTKVEKVETAPTSPKQMNPKQEEVVETAIQEDVEWVEDPRRHVKRSSSSGPNPKYTKVDRPTKSRVPVTDMNNDYKTNRFNRPGDDGQVHGIKSDGAKCLL